jgi:monoterpene epsilon-lactone hydrolase
MNLEPALQRAASEPLVERVVAAILRRLLRATLLRTFRAGRPFAEQRRRLESFARITLPPGGVSFVAGDCGGVRGEFVTSRSAAAPDHAVLYLHGGAYCVGSPKTHRAISGTLARLTGATVFVADYRLAPEHPFPAALDDAVAAYRGLVARGYTADRIAIAGDSAGGGLAVATVLRLRDLGEAVPAALALFSPWVDLSDRSAAVVPAGEVMISPPWVSECARAYLSGRDASEPLASPIHADLRGLPPTLVQVGTDEVLLTDSRRLEAALRGAGVPVQLEEFPRRWHVFQANAGVLADANRALATVASFLGGRWP